VKLEKEWIEENNRKCALKKTFKQIHENINYVFDNFEKFIKLPKKVKKSKKEKFEKNEKLNN